jgi:hypothetical protein
MHMVNPTVSGSCDQTGSTKSCAASPKADSDPGVEATHEKKRQEVKKDEIHCVQNILVMFLDIGYADNVDVAGVQAIADGLDVKESR